MDKPTVAVIGASKDRAKFGNKSVRAHARQGYEVFPIHPSEKTIEGFEAYSGIADVPVDRLDRVSVYVRPEIGITLLDAIREKQPREVWFNPGSESPELIDKATSLGLNVIQACSIVDVGMSPAELPSD